MTEDEAFGLAYEEKRKNYPQYCLTADIVCLRGSPRAGWEVLLIRRGQAPFKGKLALPGGFVDGRTNESVDAAARRELKEETGAEASVLIPVDVFSEDGRDPRKRVVSFAYLALFWKGAADGVKGGDDASEAKWVPLSFDPAELKTGRIDVQVGDESLKGDFEMWPDGLGLGRVKRLEPNGFAFDHGKIVASALRELVRLPVGW